MASLSACIGSRRAAAPTSREETTALWAQVAPTCCHMVINGQHVAASNGATFESLDPATLEVVAKVPRGTTEDVDTAVAIARATFENGVWSQASPSFRREVLLKFADELLSAVPEIAVLDCIEGGKPISECLSMDAPETAHCVRWFAEAIDKLYDSVCPTGPDVLALVRREPVGVVGQVVPWNFPSLMVAWKVAPALAAGNSVVLKPAELTSLSAVRMAQLALAAGVPPGVFNVVTGIGNEAGKAIGLHMDVDMVAFTGSTRVGREFLRYSADSNCKAVTLEMGGKSPQVVFADALSTEAEVTAVAEQVVAAAFWNQSENCSCGSRLIVEASAKDKLLAEVVRVLSSSAWQIGDPRVPGVKLGPMIEAAHEKKVLGYIQAGLDAGARAVVGGSPTRAAVGGGGYFVTPTIFDNVTTSMSIWKDEIFGPVLCVVTFETEAEAIALANDTVYGLASSLYSTNVHRCHRVSRAIRAGTVSVNCFSEGDNSAPFGGYKLSGSGSAGRDKSILAIQQYCEIKTTWMKMFPQ